jgi:hypothetical protein
MQYVTLKHLGYTAQQPGRLEHLRWLVTYDETMSVVRPRGDEAGGSFRNTLAISAPMTNHADVFSFHSTRVQALIIAAYSLQDLSFSVYCGTSVTVYSRIVQVFEFICGTMFRRLLAFCFELYVEPGS